MKYIIKNTKTNKYLKSGSVFFEWTDDLYYAKVFKGLKGASNALTDIINKNESLVSAVKVIGVEMKEIEI